MNYGLKSSLPKLACILLTLILLLNDPLENNSRKNHVYEQNKETANKETINNPFLWTFIKTIISYVEKNPKISRDLSAKLR